jgi:hypothetical protein
MDTNSIVEELTQQWDRVVAVSKLFAKNVLTGDRPLQEL